MIHWECVETGKVRIKCAIPDLPGDDELHFSFTGQFDIYVGEI